MHIVYYNTHKILFLPGLFTTNYSREKVFSKDRFCFILKHLHSSAYFKQQKGTVS